MDSRSRSQMEVRLCEMRTLLPLFLLALLSCGEDPCRRARELPSVAFVQRAACQVCCETCEPKACEVCHE